MPTRRIQIVAAVLLTVGVGALFYYFFVAPGVNERNRRVAEEAAPQEKVLRHPLNGVPVAQVPEFFPVSVMYDNFPGTSHWPGLEHARIVYEALAEGGITRFMAVFDSSQEVQKIGPVRSVRPYFIDWAREYGGAIMHVGGSAEALAELKIIDDSDLVDIDQIGADETYFDRDESIRAPHNVFSSFSSWRRFGERMQIATRTPSMWRFENPARTAETASQQIDIRYAPDNLVTWVLRPDDGLYLRFLNNERQQWTDGKQVGAATVVVIEVPSETIDAIGRQKMKTVGSGKAVVYRGGAATEGTWIKETRGSRMKFVGTDQQELALSPGQIWIQVVPDMSQTAVRQTRAGS